MRITNHSDLFAALGADDEREACGRLYKDTDCGAWLDAGDPRSVLLGTIVEGSTVEPIVAPRRLWYPFDERVLDEAIAAIEADADVCWRHVNECPDDCDGGCGYTDHAGAIEIDLGRVPRPPAKRRYRVRLARSIVGWVPVTARDLRAHQSVPHPLPPALVEWLGGTGRRGAVPYDSPEGEVLSQLASGTSTDHEARPTPRGLWLTTDPL